METGPRSSDSWTRLICGGVLVLASAGCYTTAGVGYPAEFIDTHRPSRIWVTESNDSILAVDNPQIRSDTLTGYVVGAYRELPMSDVKFVRGRVLNAGRTAMLAGVAALAAAGAVVSLTGTKGQANICFNGADQQVPCPTQ
jgi:hypothetical protein